MLRILACLVLFAFVDTFENGSRIQGAVWQYSVYQAYKFNQSVENWLRNLRP
jgi:hypothetical protein